MDLHQSEVKKRASKVAKLIVRKGMKVSHAMQEAGFSKTQSRKGFPELLRKPAMRKALEKETKKFSAEMGTLPGATERAKMIRWRLTKNILAGDDKAVASCKLAGLDKEVRLFEPENQAGYIVVNVQSNFLPMDEEPQPVKFTFAQNNLPTEERSAVSDGTTAEDFGSTLLRD